MAMLCALLAVVIANAAVWFWPMPVWELEQTDGTTIVGQIVERTEGSRAHRGARLYVKTGSRELTHSDFEWVAVSSVASATTPMELARIVRRHHGDAYGRVTAAIGPDGERSDVDELPRLLRQTARQQDRVEALEAKRRLVRRPLARLEERLAGLRRLPPEQRSERAEEAADLRAEHESWEMALGPELDRLEARIATIRDDLAAHQLVVRGAGTRFTVPLSEVVEVTHPNQLGVGSKLLLSLQRVARFLTSEPFAANTQGGVFPALFSTVLLVILMSIAVVPLGVVTAIYLSEYARASLWQRLARLAVHNLAGVPSIVFGMFGLAFFIYGIGGHIDHALFSESLPSPTFGTGGILWASLTLALLTLPVVVVATEEGLAAVPRSWREGALALGATRWQTLRSVVLPAARPGVLTGVILAVSRAAGEVAPLMLTGVVKLAQGLPLDTEPPFVHLERKFMHLGYHIYDVSMQSPNVEAAKPMAFATALVLIVLVLGLNMTAILVRRRLRGRMQGRAV
jgi:phosphate transport system permease protein